MAETGMEEFTGIIEKAGALFNLEIMSIRCPRLPRIPPQADHKNTTL
jgi:hypothetical protein